MPLVGLCGGGRSGSVVMAVVLVVVVVSRPRYAYAARRRDRKAGAFLAGLEPANPPTRRHRRRPPAPRIMTNIKGNIKGPARRAL